MQQRAIVMVGAVLWSAFLVGAEGRAAEPAKAHPGMLLAFNVGKGNCLACHGMPTVEAAEQPGNSGPPLIAMSARFPDKAVLRARIWDATAANPDSLMPPFGKHKVLTEQEIDQILEFIYEL